MIKRFLIKILLTFPAIFLGITGMIIQTFFTLTDWLRQFVLFKPILDLWLPEEEE